MDILKLINKAVSAANPKEYRQYIGASSIGKPCKRAIWYGYHGAEQKDVSSALQITFDIGKTLEKLLLEYIGLTDLKLEIPLEENKWLFCQDSELKEFQGHMDGLLYLDELSPTVLEIKTAKSSSFQKFVKDGLLKWNYIYYAQLQAYMGMANLNEGILLAINKDNSELHMETVEFDYDYYELLKDKVRTILESKEPPDKINNNSCFIICQRCDFQKICHYGV